MEIGQLLTFNIYGTIVKGKFLSNEDNNALEVEITEDSSGVSKVGEKCRLHNSFLINQ